MKPKYESGAKKPAQLDTLSEPGSWKPSSDADSDVSPGKYTEQEQKRVVLSLKVDSCAHPCKGRV